MRKLYIVGQTVKFSKKEAMEAAAELQGGRKQFEEWEVFPNTRLNLRALATYTSVKTWIKNYAQPVAKYKKVGWTDDFKKVN